MKTLRLGTRRSNLAMWQANYVAARLREAHPDLEVEIISFVTEGDRILGVPLSQVGGKGLFIKEIEQALLERTIDIAVHSMKDMPGFLPEGLGIVCVPEREDPRDALISANGAGLKDLRPNAVLGSASLRRGSQIKHLRPDIHVTTLRGSVETRLRKLESGEFDATLLAYAGLKRLGLADKVTEILSAEWFVPAVGQGALAIEARLDDADVRFRLAPLHHADTADTTAAERGFMAQLEGGCSLPLAGHAVLKGELVVLDALVASPTGSPVVRGTDSAPRSEATAMGKRLGARLLDEGGREILAACLASQAK
jgi:hydroxymethylbilane synthase